MPLDMIVISHQDAVKGALRKSLEPVNKWDILVIKVYNEPCSQILLKCLLNQHNCIEVSFTICIVFHTAETFRDQDF